MSFRNLLSRFENCLAGLANDAERLKFLKCLLCDRPLLLINHLTICNKNYRAALTVLKNEYIDEDEIIDNIFQDILDISIRRKKHFATLTKFISKTTSLLAELESPFGCTFSDDRSSGVRLMAKILISRFPRKIKSEIIQLFGKRILTLSIILCDTREIVKRFLIKGSDSFDPAPNAERRTLRDGQSRPRFNVTRKDSSFRTHFGSSTNLPLFYVYRLLGTVSLPIARHR